MKVFPEKLPAALERGLAPVYLVAGPERLLVEEACDAVRRAARRREVSERITLVAGTGFDWGELERATESGSLFAARRLVEVRLPTGRPGRDGAAAIRAWLERGGDDVLLLICDQWTLDQERAVWAREVGKAGVYVPAWQVKAHQLPGWIADRLKSRGLNADPAVCQFLAGRLEGNLLAAAQEVDRLALLFGTGKLQLEQVQQAVFDSARFDSFRLVELALTAQPGAVLRCIRGLRESATPPPMILAALAREVSLLGSYQHLCRRLPPAQAFSELKIWKSRQAALSAAAERLASEEADGILCRLAQLDLLAKGRAEGDFWLELERVSVALAGSGRAQ